MKVTLLCKYLLTGCIAACGAAHAQAPARILVDPMRPAGMADTGPSRQGAARDSAAGVQVILTSAERKLALIDGKVVPLGGAARGGTLVGLSESGAVLDKDGSRDVLLMHPAIDKKPPLSAARK